MISSLTTAIIIIALAFLPLNDGHTLASFPLFSDSVYAQPFSQAFPYGEEQDVLTLRSSSSSSTMGFGMFMDSFANSIFNGTSTFAGVGTSIVDGLEVSGITLDMSQNQLSVTLSHTARQVGTSNNDITSTDTTTITQSRIPNFDSVSVIAMRIPISMSDILSMAASSSPSSSLNALDGETGDNSIESGLDSFSSNSSNPFSLLSNLQIGSGTLIDVDWSGPQTVTMDLIGGSSNRTDQEQQLNSSSETMADFVLVSVIPYTGVGNNTISSTIP
jgi:hypothetical protein